MSAEIARLKLKFEPKKSAVVLGQTPGAPPPRATPAYYEMRLKEQKKSQMDAAKKARQSAARYNLTMRALHLSSAKKANDERVRQMDEIQKAKELASHYNATARALKVATTGVPKKAPASLFNSIKTKISEGDEGAVTVFSAEPTPKENSAAVDNAADIPSASETTTVDVDVKQDESTESKVDEEPAAPSTETHIMKDEEVKPEEVAESKADDPPQTENERPDTPTTSFALTEVEDALKEGKDEVINEVLVRTFLEEVDPERAKDAPKLLEEYKGKEEELMQSLLLEVEATSDDEKLGESLISGNAGESAGFITSGKMDASKGEWSMSTVKDEQFEALKSKLLAKGLKENEISKMIDDSSEML